MKYLKVAMFLVCIGFANQKASAQVIVNDPINLIENATTAITTVLKWRKYLEEYEIIENQIRGIADLIGDDGLELVLEKLVEEWGTDEMIDVISSIDPDSESFLDDVNDLLEATLGGIALDDAEIDELIANTGIEDEQYIEDITNEFIVYRNRDALYKQSIYAASQADDRRLEMQEQISAAIDQLASLGEESEVASIQFVGETNLLLANQNQELLGVMARILAKQHERDMIENMEVMILKKLGSRRSLF